MLAKVSSRYWIYFIASLLYVFGIWLHIPYGGGRIYSDIVTVFQIRNCTDTCQLRIPYIDSFIEYPVIVSLFIYSMGIIGSIIPGELIKNYYLVTTLTLALPSFLAIRELFIISQLKGIRERNVLLFFVATPTFIYMLLLNWYIIGVFFTLLAVRKFLEGKYGLSGLFIGISACSNLVTAAPALGLLLSMKDLKNALRFLLIAILTFIIINLPFIIINSKLWLSFWNYHYNWYIEGSWMLAFLASTSPFRHIIPAILYLAIVALLIYVRFSKRINEPIILSSIAVFGFIFSTYVYTPQMNLMLTPFFAILSFASYPEFIIFDTINSLIIVLGFSQPLLPLGITISIEPFGYFSIIQWFAIIRSFWVGKFTVNLYLFIEKSREGGLL